ncbi:response regulator [Bacillaceae bacterium Marseille-Q3522]|nr:response regulator [Bacillaceae bacterium Marseille-Q3522]
MFKLMIVEDEPLERIALRKITQRSFYDIDIVEDAKNGTEGIEKARRFQPDIILMDIRMPETSGLEAQKRIIQYLPNVKTIILTAHSDFQYAQEAIKEGVFDYLLKPVRPDDLNKSIKKALAMMYKTPLSAEKTKPEDTASGKEMLKSALRYIELHYMKEIKLNTVAEKVHLNPQYFSRIFKKEFHVTFTEYVTQLRIEAAKKLLLQTERPVYRIAIELGFADAAYFSKVFFKSVQCTPIEFRKRQEYCVQ